MFHTERFDFVMLHRSEAHIDTSDFPDNKMDIKGSHRKMVRKAMIAATLTEEPLSSRKHLMAR